MTDNHGVTDAMKADAKLVEGIRRELDESCRTLDGHTLSRLNSIRHAALERQERRPRTLLLPFGGLVTACVLVLSVSLINSGRGPDAGVANDSDVVAGAPLADIDLLISDEDLDFYEDYEFYQWLAESGSSI